MPLKTITKEETLTMLKKAAASKPPGFKYPRHIFTLAKEAKEEWALELAQLGEYDSVDVQCRYEDTIAGETVHCIVGDILLNQLNVGHWLAKDYNSEASYVILGQELQIREDIVFDYASRVILELAQDMQDDDVSWDEIVKDIVDFVAAIDSRDIPWSSLFTDVTDYPHGRPFFRYWKASRDAHNEGDHRIPRKFTPPLNWVQDHCKVEVFNPRVCVVPGCQEPMTEITQEPLIK